MSSTEADAIILRHMDAVSQEAMAKKITPESIATSGISYLIAGLVLGSPRWSPEKVAKLAKECADGYAARLRR